MPVPYIGAILLKLSLLSAQLIMAVTLDGANSAAAGEVKCSMAAVCDFIGARFFEANSIVVNVGGAVPDPKNPGIGLYSLQYKDTTVHFYIVEGERRIAGVHTTGATLLPDDNNKNALLRRLGVKPEAVLNRFEAGCDAATMELVFNKNKLSEIRVYTQSE